MKKVQFSKTGLFMNSVGQTALIVSLVGTTIFCSSSANAATIFEQIPTGWTFQGNAGSGTADGDVSISPSPTGTYKYVSTSGGIDGVGSIYGYGGDGQPTNGSTLTSTSFTGKIGEKLEFFFNYVTSDGAGFSDYAWARLVDTAGETISVLFTARTTPEGNSVPGFALPEPSARLNPEVVQIKSAATDWSALGNDSGSCYSIGCGSTGWVSSSFVFKESGSYQLEVGVTNWNDTAFASALAVDVQKRIIAPTETVLRAPNSDVYFESGGNLFVDGVFNADNPTVILTHGWQPNVPKGVKLQTGPIMAFLPDAPPSAGDVDFTREMAAEIRATMGNDVNIIIYNWDEAFALISGARNLAQGDLADIGYRLAAELQKVLPSGYNEDIQFIGHSYGTAVNAYAIEDLTASGIRVAQATIIDAPTQNRASIDLGLRVPVKLYTDLIDNVDRLENFFGGGTFAVGSPIKGAINTLYPDASHSGAWKEYLGTISNPNIQDGGFYFSTLLQNGGFAPSAPVTIAPSFSIPISQPSPLFQNASFNNANSTILSQGSDAFAVYDIFVPNEVDTLSFYLQMLEVGEDDWFEVFFNDVSIFAILASSFSKTGRDISIDVSEFTGQSGFLSFLMNDNGISRTTLAVSNMQFTGGSEVAIAPVPLPSSGLLFFVGLLVSWCFVGRTTTLANQNRKAVV